MLGGTRKVALAAYASLAVGLMAGTGEEMLFRGVLQTDLTDRIGVEASLLLSSFIFALLHAVTPLYAMIAGAVSLYFGILYNYYDNLTVPIVCHTVYDFFAIFGAHLTVTRMSEDEQVNVLKWKGPGES
mmetsp:Transcript_9924/g.14044  ORF Transcript_9924/g.14044 Transcript_9924/m.14044 type:complete len:129 (+) Transcript_9924:1-387(+)